MYFVLSISSLLTKLFMLTYVPIYMIFYLRYSFHHYTKYLLLTLSSHNFNRRRINHLNENLVNSCFWYN